MTYRKHIPLLFLLLIIGTFSNPTTAQQQLPPLENHVSVLFGLNQPILAGGFNIEGNFLWKRLAFDYSHGISLKLKGAAVMGKMKEQQLSAHIPFTTGFGVGYRFNDWLNLRLEPKWHRFQIYYANSEWENSNLIADYVTFSLGIGLYVNWRPFKKMKNFLKGIMIAPSIRYWPTIASTLPDDEVDYFNKLTNRQETHKRQEIGFANTPFVFNISIGYAITF